ncbi:serine protease [Aquimarina sp. MMG016]|uniref:S1 family peptidase n=1 Tax=Aquimarina sp. MMG016 TaxID=2822690 RepID=UPI001B3A41F4|nr:serine protease [Aquimarina sp. MMG016]MBQ4822774.1 trypsin-like peptidase domain-containing protein [Aquimarina sp. MMG016]
MISKSQYLRERKTEVIEIIQFFLSKSLNPELHKSIVSFFTKKGEQKLAHRIGMGLFSSMDFGEYQGGAEFLLVNHVLNILVDNSLITKMDMLFPNENLYQANTAVAKAANEFGAIENLVFGFEHIANRYSNSVFKIENTASNDDKDIGTGFLTSVYGRQLIITNNHVVSNFKKIRLFTKNDMELEFKVSVLNEELDIAILELKTPISSDNLNFNEVPNLLSDIITIGYPSIPMAKEAYQVCHRGEINSHIEDYRGNNLFLISAKTSTGNSGSPIIDERGLVLGILTRELYEKDALLSKGKLPYYAVIPSNVILKIIKEAYA